MIRNLIASLLALILAATSVSAAVMRAEMQGATQIEICSDSHDASGLTTITLDATGRQISHHTCPDCTAALPALLPGLTRATAPAKVSNSLFQQTPRHTTSRTPPTGTARDPPTFA